MSDLVQQNSILQNALQLFLDEFSKPEIVTTMSVIRTDLAAGLLAAVLNARNVMTIRLENWTYWPALSGIMPYDLIASDKIEVGLANGDQVVARAGHINWEDLSTEHPNVTVTKYRKL